MRISLRSFNYPTPPPPHLSPGNPVHLIVVRAWVGWGISKRSFRSFQRNTRVFYLQNMTLTTLLILAICRMRIIYELCNGLAHHRVSTAQLVEHRSAEPEGLRFAFSWGLRIIFFVPCSWQDEKSYFFISLPSSKLTILLILFTKNIVFSDLTHNTSRLLRVTHKKQLLRFRFLTS